MFVLASAAGQAVFAAAISWISVCAADHQRATLIGFGAIFVAVESALLGAVLGAIAQQHSANWPGLVMLMLNLVAVGATHHAPTRPAADGHCQAPVPEATLRRNSSGYRSDTTPSAGVVTRSQANRLRRTQGTSV